MFEAPSCVEDYLLEKEYIKVLLLYPINGKRYVNHHQALTDWTLGKDFRFGKKGHLVSIQDHLKLFQHFDEIYLVFGKSNDRRHKLCQKPSAGC